MAQRCNTPILWSSSLLLVQSRPDAFKAIIVGILFITFCVNGIRSVLNDKHFVSCYDRWHNCSIVLIFDELLIFF